MKKIIKNCLLSMMLIFVSMVFSQNVFAAASDYIKVTSVEYSIDDGVSWQDLSYSTTTGIISYNAKGAESVKLKLNLSDDIKNMPYDISYLAIVDKNENTIINYADDYENTSMLMNAIYTKEIIFDIKDNYEIYDGYNLRIGRRSDYIECMIYIIDVLNYTADVTYSDASNGTFYASEGEIPLEVGKTMSSIYAKLNINSTMNVSSIKITGQNNTVLYNTSNINGKSYNTVVEFTGNHNPVKVEMNFGTYSKVKEFIISRVGEENPIEILSEIKYGATENGTFYDNELDAAFPIGQEISKVYAKIILVSNIDMTGGTITWGSGANAPIGNYVAGKKICTFTYPVTESSTYKLHINYNGGNKTIASFDVTMVGKTPTITATVQYGAAQNGRFYDNEADVLYPGGDVDTVYAKVTLKSDSVNINSLNIARTGGGYSENSAIGVKEYTGTYALKTNGTYTVNAITSAGTYAAKSIAISRIGETVTVAITGKIQYGASENGEFFDSEEDVMFPQGRIEEVYVKLTLESTVDMTYITVNGGDPKLVSLSGVKEHTQVFKFTEAGEGYIIQISYAGGMVPKLTNKFAITKIGSTVDNIIIGTVKYGSTSSSAGAFYTSEGSVPFIDEEIKNIYVKVDVQSNVDMTGIKLGGTATETASISGKSCSKIYTLTQNGNYTITITYSGGEKKINNFTINRIGEKSGISIADQIDWSVLNDASWQTDVIDWSKGYSATNIILGYKNEVGNVPEIIVSPSRVTVDPVMVTIKTENIGKSGYDIRYRIRPIGSGIALTPASSDWSSWNVYTGPFYVASNSYIEAEGRENESNASGQSTIYRIDNIVPGETMEVREDINLPFVSKNQNLLVYYAGDISGKIGMKKYYKIGDNLWDSFDAAEGFEEYMNLVDVGSENTKITLKKMIDDSEGVSAEYVVKNYVNIVTSKVEGQESQKSGKTVVVTVNLTAGAPITSDKIKEVGVIREYELNSNVYSSILNTTDINGKNGTFTFTFNNTPKSASYRAYYVNEDNEMILGTSF